MAEPTHILTRRLSVTRASCQRSFPTARIFPNVQGQLSALGKPSFVCDPEGPLLALLGSMLKVCHSSEQQTFLMGTGSAVDDPELTIRTSAEAFPSAWRRPSQSVGSETDRSASHCVSRGFRRGSGTMAFGQGGCPEHPPCFLKLSALDRLVPAAVPFRPLLVDRIPIKRDGSLHVLVELL